MEIQTQKTILIVEDELPLLRAIDDKLRKNGYQTFAASRVDQAIEYLKGSPKVDAIWLDHYLPGKTGDELVLYMKQKDSVYQRVPIFLVSNTASADKIYSYMQLGVDRYFVKADRRLDEIIADVTKFLEGNNL